MKPILCAAILSAATLAPPCYAAPQDSVSYHLYVPNRAPARATGSELYYGGPVLANVKTVAVIWGNGVAPITKSRIGPFLQALPNSTYLDQLVQYSTNLTGVNGHKGTDQTIARGSYLGQFIIKPANKATKLTDADVQTELKGQIAAGKLPANDLNTLYMIYFPAKISISIGGAQSCVSFGAYHSSSSPKVTASNLFYGVMPNCGGGFIGQTIASSHEFAEAVTDAIPTPGSNPAYPQAWNTSNGLEIGDLCEGNDTTLVTSGTTYRVQEVYDNSKAACATGKFKSP
jgi:hypothetical protein